MERKGGWLKKRHNPSRSVLNQSNRDLLTAEVTEKYQLSNAFIETLYNKGDGYSQGTKQRVKKNENSTQNRELKI